MKISGHKTRSVFDRYNITSTDDVKDARGQGRGVQQAQAEIVSGVYSAGLMQGAPNQGSQ
jgi:hypothetical protein